MRFDRLELKRVAVRTVVFVAFIVAVGLMRPAVEQLIGQDNARTIGVILIGFGVLWALWRSRPALAAGFREIRADSATGPLRRPRGRS